MNRIFAVVAVLSVLGCASVDYKREVTDEFTPPAGTTPEQVKKDWAGCRQTMMSTTGWTAWTTGQYDEHFAVCMEAKGYSVRKSAPPPR